MIFLLVLYLSFPSLISGKHTCATGDGNCDRNSRERLLDGSCNNIKNPSWGSAGALFTRLLPAAYHDGKYLKLFTNMDMCVYLRNVYGLLLDTMTYLSIVKP